MNHRIRNRFSKVILAVALLTIGSQTFAQNDAVEFNQEKKGSNKAWEVGVGGTGLYMTRMSVLNFTNTGEGSYGINVNKRDVLFGGNFYAARQLGKYFYLDFQGTMGYAQDPIRDGKENRFLYMGGLGLQWRLGEYFESKYIDPFFRIGGNYMHKTFTQLYSGTEQHNGSQVGWDFNLDHNKYGADRKNLTPISLGTGVNMWLSDRFGIGLQADYLYMPYKDVANIWQGTARLIWRIGGKSKKPVPVVHTVEHVIEKIIEKPTIVEKYIDAPVTVQEESLCELFHYIFFDFDKATITQESEETLDKIADILKTDTTRKYLITGYTDSRGSSEYNIALSDRRAKAVIDALLKRDVPQEMIKSRGVGKKIAYVHPGAPDDTRRGDRKVSVERVINMDYWNYLK